MAWRDVSFDIETLGKSVDAPVLSIAAVAFDRNTGKLGPETELHIKLDDMLHYSKPDASTVIWWLEQSDKARKVIVNGQQKAVSVYEALRGLGDFVRGLPAGVSVWGNGATFDVSIIERLYRVAGNGLMEQWQFWSVRDMRTILEAARFDKDTVKFVGEKHVALDDARHQAKIIAACLMKIDKSLGVSHSPIMDEDDEL